MSAIDGEEDFSRNGTAAPTAFTVCIMSVRKDFSQVSGESPTARALTLQTSASSPPSSAAVAAIQSLSAAPSATSSAWPKAFTPFAFSDDTVSHVPKWRGGIERLALEDVEIGAGEMAALKGRDDVAFDRDFTARDVDEMAPRRHRLEGRRVGDAARRGRGRAAQDQPVGLGQRFQQLVVGDGAVAGFDRLGAAMGAEDGHAQHLQMRGNVAADRTQADDHRALAF